MESRRAGRISGMRLNLHGRAGLLARITAGLLALLLTAVVLVGTARADTKYTVQSGDTLTGIASKYGVTVDAIVAANNLSDRSVIFAGQVLTIPSLETPTHPAQSLRH